MTKEQLTAFLKRTGRTFAAIVIGAIGTGILTAIAAVATGTPPSSLADLQALTPIFIYTFSIACLGSLAAGLDKLRRWLASDVPTEPQA